MSVHSKFIAELKALAEPMAKEIFGSHVTVRPYVRTLFVGGTK